MFVHLLDASQGHPLQTWRFADRDLITIGRDDDNDIVIVDPQVSRSHAKLVRRNGAWELISLGRHGTLVDDRIVSEVALQHQTVFRLGSGGPMLRFDAVALPNRRNETIENVSADFFAMLEVDEARKQQEVEQIVENDLFRQLKEQSRRAKMTEGPN